MSIKYNGVTIYLKGFQQKKNEKRAQKKNVSYFYYLPREMKDMRNACLVNHPRKHTPNKQGGNNSRKVNGTP